jgi:hypothetical protein
MKFIVLTDSKNGDFEKMVGAVQGKEPFLVDTQDCDKRTEYEHLLFNVDLFSQSNKEIMLVKFSGKEEIVQNLGDERPEMIVSLSDNKKSKYYTESTIDMFLSLINIFDKETK